MHHTLRRAIIVTLSILVATAFGWARAANVTATLDSSETFLGEAAQLTVTIQSQSSEAPQIPAVNGLTFQPVGQSSQIEIVDGAMSANVNYLYAVAASRYGTFIIPPIKVADGPDAAQSPAITLKVVQRTGGTSAGANSPNRNALPAPTVNADNEDIHSSARNSFGFLRLVTPKREFYVGEMAPVELKAYFRAGVELRVDGLPTLNSDAFTMNKLGNQPLSSQEVIQGARYTVFTWPTAITAVKAGNYEMSVEIPVTVTMRQRPQRPHGGDPFGDDAFDAMFDNFFGTATQKQIALNSEPNPVKILSLPGDNRPAGFTGAVGRFDLIAEAVPAQIVAGDPVTFKLKITGKGNFDRVTAPVVESNGAWKTYKPGAKFEPSDSDGFSGTKNFEQALVPTQAGKQVIPSLAFSYFDPEQKQYVIRTTAPINVEVGGTDQILATTAAPPPTKPTVVPSSVKTVSDLASNKLGPGRFTATLRPWFLNLWLVAIALLPTATMLGMYLIIRRRTRLACDPEHVRRVNTRRALGEQFQAMECAAERGAAADFFTAACAAFQILLGQHWNLSPRTITLAEINVRLNGEADGLRTIFGLADEAIYTDRVFASHELRHWQALVNHELRKLEEL
jgi:hypothetical protein